MLGVAIRWLINSIRDLLAKKSLEDKLGRKVGSHEIYSIGANIEAAEAAQDRAQQPAVQLEPPAPPQPMSGTKKIVLGSLAALVLLLVGGAVLGVVVMMMPTATYNRLNPFTPKVPAGAFPTSIAGRDLVAEPAYDNKSYCPCYSFTGQYKKDKDTIYYVLVVFKTPEEAVKKMKERYFIGSQNKITEQTDSRLVTADPKSGGVTTTLVAGNYLIYYAARTAADSVEFENALPYAALGMAQPPPRIAEMPETPIQALTVFDEFYRDKKAAEVKYHGKVLLFSGTVESIGEEKGIAHIAIKKPDAKPGEGGILGCTFAASETTKISLLKKGDIVKFRGLVDAKSPSLHIYEARLQ